MALSGNNFYTGYGVSPIRAKLVRELKAFYWPHVRSQLTPFAADSYPLRIEWEIHTPISSKLPDLSNFHFYWKYLEDTLCSSVDPDGKTVSPIIPDDNYRYITHPPGPRLHPIELMEERLFRVRFYKDDRAEVQNLT